METNQTGLAIQSFESIVKDTNARFYEQAQWYLGLGYLKMGDSDKARFVFQSIITGNGSYSPRAAEVYELIE